MLARSDVSQPLLRGRGFSPDTSLGLEGHRWFGVYTGGQGGHCTCTLNGHGTYTLNGYSYRHATTDARLPGMVKTVPAVTWSPDVTMFNASEMHRKATANVPSSMRSGSQLGPSKGRSTGCPWHGHANL